MRLRMWTTALLLFAGAARAASAQHAVVIVRHAEKQTESNEPETPLSEAGKARAERLAALLRDAGVTAIYATDTVRARKTAEPLARILKMEVGKYDSRQPQPLLERLRAEHSVGLVLVVGHSNTVPGLLTALGHKEEVRIASDEFDNLFILIPKKEGSPALLRLRY